MLTQSQRSKIFGLIQAALSRTKTAGTRADTSRWGGKVKSQINDIIDSSTVLRGIVPSLFVVVSTAGPARSRRALRKWASSSRKTQKQITWRSCIHSAWRGARLYRTAANREKGLLSQDKAVILCLFIESKPAVAKALILYASIPKLIFL